MSKTYCTRGYQMTVEVWSDGVVHDKPAIELFLEKDNVTIHIVDDYGYLEDVLEKLLEKVLDKRAQDDSGTGGYQP